MILWVCLENYQMSHIMTGHADQQQCAATFAYHLHKLCV